MSEEILERSRHWLEKLLNLAQMSASVEVSKAEEDVEPGYWLNIDTSNLTPGQIRLIIGEDGRVIDAIQYLANAALNQDLPPEAHLHFTIEVGGYRYQRLQKLKDIAQTALSKARETGQDVEIRSLSSVERRQVHHILKDCEDIETHSYGQEPNRCLVVRLKQPL